MVMFQKGLKDVVAVHTYIASVEGIIGELRYLGVKVDELIPQLTFEQLAYFLWTGDRTADPQEIITVDHLVLRKHVHKSID